MTKSEFILSLSEALASLPGRERSRVLEYYEEMIDDRIESGMTEEDAVAAMGSIEEILKEAAPEAMNLNSRKQAEEIRSNPDENVFELREPVRNLIANSASAELQIRSEALPNGLTARVDYDLADNEECVCTLENGTLTVKYRTLKQRGFSLRNLFSCSDSSITITLADPALERGEIGASSGNIDLHELVFTDSLEVTTASGELEAHDIAIHHNCTLHTASGDITASGLTCGDLCEIHSASGDIDLKGFRAGRLEIGTASGDPNVNGVVCDELEASSASGDVELYGVQADKITAGTASGDLTLSGASCSGIIELSSVSGDIEIHGAQCSGEIHLSSTSGDINGTLSPEENYTFSARSRTGDVSVPRTNGPCPVEIHTTTGDINF